MQTVLNSLWSELVAAAFLACAACSAQTVPVPSSSPVSLVTALSRVEDTDAGSGVHYVRLSISPQASAAASDPAPRFTVECRDVKGKHNLLWFLSFGGVPVQPFEPPFKPTAGILYPPKYHKVMLKMDFEGYMRSKPYVRAWEALPSGEFRFCSASSACPNMETARFYMSFLNALPTLRISYEKPSDGLSHEQIFDLRTLVDETNKTPLCTP